MHTVKNIDLKDNKEISSDQLREHIACLEARLGQLYGDGDCAYERAIGRTYQRLVDESRARLAAMRAAGL